MPLKGQYHRDYGLCKKNFQSPATRASATAVVTFNKFATIRNYLFNVYSYCTWDVPVQMYILDRGHIYSRSWCRNLSVSKQLWPLLIIHLHELGRFTSLSEGRFLSITTLTHFCQSVDVMSHLSFPSLLVSFDYLETYFRFLCWFFTAIC